MKHRLTLTPRELEKLKLAHPCRHNFELLLQGLKSTPVWLHVVH